MSMEITEEENVSTLQRALHHEFRVVIDRVELARRSNPLPVQILSHQRAPIVANDYTIWVQHWYNLEDEGAPEEFSVLVVTNQEVNDAIHEPGRVTFTRMNT